MDGHIIILERMVKIMILKNISYHITPYHHNQQLIVGVKLAKVLINVVFGDETGNRHAAMTSSATAEEESTRGQGVCSQLRWMWSPLPAGRKWW